MMHPYDWAMYEDPEDDEFEEEFPDEFDDYYLPVFDPTTGLFTVVERIREYVQDPEITRREIEAVQAYIESGIAQFEALLQRHAEFDAWLAERGD